MQTSSGGDRPEERRMDASAWRRGAACRAVLLGSPTSDNTPETLPKRCLRTVRRHGTQFPTARPPACRERQPTPRTTALAGLLAPSPAQRAPRPAAQTPPRPPTSARVGLGITRHRGVAAVLSASTPVSRQGSSQPARVRWTTIRWMTSPGGSHANRVAVEAGVWWITRSE